VGGARVTTSQGTADYRRVAAQPGAGVGERDLHRQRGPAATFTKSPASRVAAFQNPEFYKAQAMRRPTFGKPRIIACADESTRITLVFPAVASALYGSYWLTFGIKSIFCAPAVVQSAALLRGVTPTTEIEVWRRQVSSTRSARIGSSSRN
jgi:hypothetical protein